MCLISFAFDIHSEYSLVVAANRDEFFERSTEPAHFWPDHPDVLAGRDQVAGGTWLGITRRGRFAAITNHRNPATTPAQPRSRGMLTLDFLRGEQSPAEYLSDIAKDAASYAGFNLLVGDTHSLHYLSNVQGTARELQPGVYSVSNGLLDANWPKQRHAESALSALLAEQINHETLAATLQDTTQTPDEDLPHTGVGLEQERALSAPFVVLPGYGTRNTTTLSVSRRGEVALREQSFGEGARPLRCEQFSFHLNAHV